MIKIEKIKGDITTLHVDAIVNAANSSLMGGGVDGAIHQAAGPKLLEACRRLRETDLPDGLPTGEAVITPGFDLPAKNIIHTVGPVWNGGKSKETELLELCYLNCLKIADENQVESIAFPAISTGVYGFPKEVAHSIAQSTIKKYIIGGTEIKKIFLVEY